jgi:hypothetical protein
MESVRNGVTIASEVRARALDVVEMYAKRTDHWGLGQDGAEQATRLVEKGGKAFGTAVARQMLTTGSPEYLAAFELLERPGRLRLPCGAVPDARERRVPGAVHPGPDDHPDERRQREPVPAVREREDDRHERLERRHVAGVSAEWTGEGVEAADATPTVGQLKITPQKADAYLFGSFEVLGDSDFAAQLPELLADAKDRLEETAFAVGSGTLQPWGIITRGTSQNRAGTAAAGPAAQDVYALMAALPARFRGPGRGTRGSGT